MPIPPTQFERNSPVPFRNDSGKTIPAYGCLAVYKYMPIGGESTALVKQPSDD